MENLKTDHELIQNEQQSAYSTLRDEVPFAGDVFIGPIPEELKDIPENIARICLKEREIMNSPENRRSRAYNIFANNEQFHSPEDFSIKTPGFKDIIDSPDFWQAERAELHRYGISCQFEKAVALSDSMRTKERELGIPPTIYILSGVSASGKTSACKNANFPGMLFETKPDGSKGDPIGPLATDNSKDYLWMAGGSCNQIHAESSMMMRAVDALWGEHVRLNNGDCSEVRDRTFSAVGDIEGIIKDAQETGRRICDLDIDVPFLVSAVGVMLRPKGSHEPHPGFDYLTENYADMRATRRKKLENLYPGSGLNISYSLRCYDYTSDPKERQKEVARYEEGPNGEPKLIILDQELFEQAVVTNEGADDCFMEARAIGDQLVTPEFVEEYCQTYTNPDEQKYREKVKRILSEYVDTDNPKTVREIIDENANA